MRHYYYYDRLSAYAVSSSGQGKGNEQKHGITFDEASTVFKDFLSLTIHDPLHSENEERFTSIGVSHKNRILTEVNMQKDTLRGQTLLLSILMWFNIFLTTIL
ncbi:MAG: hypothetical protein GQ575_04615 [Deltaproteobacteria bacterium]|nr:hypothetical protein [Deltaproteobacteria bacterium]